MKLKKNLTVQKWGKGLKLEIRSGHKNIFNTWETSISTVYVISENLNSLKQLLFSCLKGLRDEHTHRLL